MEPEADLIGIWSERKLDILREYLRPYSQIMKSQKWCRGYYYIDGFAGKGWHISRTTGELVDGSPLLAVKTNPAFTHYYFVDLDEAHLGLLRQRIGEKPNVTYVNADANTEVLSVLRSLPHSSKKRALCLLDPYGLHLTWDVIEMAGRQETIDLFLNFPVADMNRNALHKTLDSVSQKERERMTAFMGGDYWMPLCYSEQRDLFGDTVQIKTARYPKLKAAFAERLKTQATFKYVPEPILMRNEKGGPLYYLFFASHNATAAKIVTQIFKKYNR